MPVRPLVAGEMNQVIALVEPITSGISGEEVTTWHERFSRYAVEYPITGIERLRAQAIEAEVTTRFELHWDQDAARIKSHWRVTTEGRTLEIVSAVDPERKRIKIELLCKEIVGD